LPLTLLGTKNSVEKYQREFIAAMLVLESACSRVRRDRLFLFSVVEVMLIPITC